MGTSGLDRTLLELRAFIDGIPALAWSALPDGFTEFFNQRFSDYSGLSPDQVCAQGSRHFTATTRKSSSTGGTGSRSSRTPGQMEVRLRRADGELPEQVAARADSRRAASAKNRRRRVAVLARPSESTGEPQVVVVERIQRL
jgi:PAS domain-containing protein